MTLSTIGSLSLPLIIWTLALGWLWHSARWIRNFPKVPDLTRLRFNDLEPDCAPETTRPQLTVIVPACNEADSIGTTLHSLLASTGIRLQILAVNDRSTDATGLQMHSIAEENRGKNPKIRLEVINIASLPPDWLGKPHALASAAKLADADWILFTDGDIVYSPHALARALAFARQEEADHLVMIPDWTMKTAGERAMHGAMHALSIWTVRLWRVADPKARDFLGVGAFNLIRRDTYKAIGGFEALRMEVLEDLRLGWRVKRAGYRQRVARGPGLISVRWAKGVWGVVRNLEKNLFALYRYSLALTLLASLGLAVQVALPLAALAAGGWARTGAVVMYLAVAAVYFSSRKVTRVGFWYCVAFPLAAGVFLLATLRSLTLTLARGGVLWRGTLYPLKELRARAGPFW